MKAWACSVKESRAKPQALPQRRCRRALFQITLL
nr:MAG TPA: hypothetical protein [Caudoviricetes sp.]